MPARPEAPARRHQSRPSLRAGRPPPAAAVAPDPHGVGVGVAPGERGRQAARLRPGSGTGRSAAVSSPAPPPLQPQPAECPDATAAAVCFHSGGLVRPDGGGVARSGPAGAGGEAAGKGLGAPEGPSIPLLGPPAPVPRLPSSRLAAPPRRDHRAPPEPDAALPWTRSSTAVGWGLRAWARHPAAASSPGYLGKLPGPHLTRDDSTAARWGTVEKPRLTLTDCIIRTPSPSGFQLDVASGSAAGHQRRSLRLPRSGLQRRRRRGRAERRAGSEQPRSGPGSRGSRTRLWRLPALTLLPHHTPPRATQLGWPSPAPSSLPAHVLPFSDCASEWDHAAGPSASSGPLSSSEWPLVLQAR
ncbi:PREDICTED: skin secretory protein xP2-like [Lipotes vexillifer]|uniref:Skin secretory protein xP2-like n=1 Tax=Lipotes vexillifer TaxID=118797 RepID=A0A340Y8E9_LIPVE|nr:PREDICTED: skin secretory protein xP2-like [Lipotes vexillifer]